MDGYWQIHLVTGEVIDDREVIRRWAPNKDEYHFFSDERKGKKLLYLIPKDKVLYTKWIETHECEMQIAKTLAFLRGRENNGKEKSD